MNIEDHVREAIIAELKRQSEAGEQGLRVRTGEAETTCSRCRARQVRG